MREEQEPLTFLDNVVDLPFTTDHFAHLLMESNKSRDHVFPLTKEYRGSN